MSYIMLLSDSIIAGRFLGEDGVSAINLLTPVNSVMVFLSCIISLGAVVINIFEFTFYLSEGISEFEIVSVNDSIGRGSSCFYERGTYRFAISYFGYYDYWYSVY